MVQTKSKRNLWMVFLLALAASVAVSLTMHVFSFYTLPHVQKVLVLGYLAVALGIAALRFAHPVFSRLTPQRKKALISLGIAVGVTALVLGLLSYHPAAIRTWHTLTITNSSSQSDLVLAKIELPGDQFLDFAAEFPEAERIGESVLLGPQQSLIYSREMVGGVDVSFSPVGTDPLEVDLNWDGEVQRISIPVQDEAFSVSLPGWTWGQPSLVYRLLGWVNILADGVSLAGIVFCGALWALGRKDGEARAVQAKGVSQQLMPYTIPILINLGMVVLAGLNRLIYSRSMVLTLLLFLLGVLASIPFIFRQYPRLVLRVAIGIIVLGIIFNVYVFIRPINDLHLTISTMQDDSLAALAQKAGDSTYLSMGYYRYFRGAVLHIPQPLMEELNLYSSRLETINIGLRVIDELYAYDLTPDETAQLLAYPSWQVWPKEAGGEFYLDPGTEDSAEEYYFFKSDDQYFLLTRGFITETGIIDVPLSD